MSGIQKLWSKLEDFFATKDEAFTKTIGGVITDMTSAEPIVLKIGFVPKYFELLGIGNGSGLYLRWDKNNGWIGNAGPLYNYEVSLSIITISTHMTLNGDLIWRAFG